MRTVKRSGQNIAAKRKSIGSRMIKGAGLVGGVAVAMEKLSATAISASAMSVGATDYPEMEFSWRLWAIIAASLAVVIAGAGFIASGKLEERKLRKLEKSKQKPLESELDKWH